MENFEIIFLIYFRHLYQKDEFSCEQQQDSPRDTKLENNWFGSRSNMIR